MSETKPVAYIVPANEGDDLPHEPLYPASAITSLMEENERERLALIERAEVELQKLTDDYAAEVEKRAAAEARAQAAEQEIEKLKRERYELAYAITGGEDAPGLLDSLPVYELVEIARDAHRRHSETIDREMAAEQRVKEAIEAVSEHLQWFERFICDEDELNSSTPRKVARNAQDAAAHLRAFIKEASE